MNLAARIQFEYAPIACITDQVIAVLQPFHGRGRKERPVLQPQTGGVPGAIHDQDSTVVRVSNQQRPVRKKLRPSWTVQISNRSRRRMPMAPANCARTAAAELPDYVVKFIRYEDANHPAAAACSKESRSSRWTRHRTKVHVRDNRVPRCLNYGDRPTKATRKEPRGVQQRIVGRCLLIRERSMLLINSPECDSTQSSERVRRRMANCSPSIRTTIRIVDTLRLRIVEDVAGLLTAAESGIAFAEERDPAARHQRPGVLLLSCAPRKSDQAVKSIRRPRRFLHSRDLSPARASTATKTERSSPHCPRCEVKS